MSARVRGDGHNIDSYILNRGATSFSEVTGQKPSLPLFFPGSLPAR